jgi:hypothetical protein
VEKREEVVSRLNVNVEKEGEEREKACYKRIAGFDTRIKNFIENK